MGLSINQRIALLCAVIPDELHRHDFLWEYHRVELAFAERQHGQGTPSLVVALEMAVLTVSEETWIDRCRGHDSPRFDARCADFGLSPPPRPARPIVVAPVSESERATWRFDHEMTRDVGEIPEGARVHLFTDGAMLRELRDKIASWVDGSSASEAYARFVADVDAGRYVTVLDAGRSAEPRPVPCLVPREALRFVGANQ